MAAGHVVRLQYEVKEGLGTNEVREGDFVARLQNGRLKFVDAIANGG